MKILVVFILYFTRQKMETFLLLSFMASVWIPKATADTPFMATTWGTTQGEGYQKRLVIHLADNKWKPVAQNGVRYPNMPYHDEPLATFEGDPIEAYTIFRKSLTSFVSTARKLENAMELLTGTGDPKAARYNPALESIFISGGMMSNGRDGFADNVISALAMRNILKNFNVFVLDLTDLNWSITISCIKSFFGLTPNYKGMAAAIGGFIDSAKEKNLMEINKVHLVGFCYSGALLGFVARYLEQRRKMKVKSILALDPNSLGLSSLRGFVSAEDAEVVHVYHTNSHVFGTFRRKATADFVFNNGLWQPGCYGWPRCSHSQSVFFLLYIIAYPQMFVARQCSSWIAFRFCRCGGKPTVRLTFPPAPGAIGRYYLRTHWRIPFGIGEEGAECR